MRQPALYEDVASAAAARHLAVLGGFHPMAEDNAPQGAQTILLLGPDEPRFWPAFTQTPEFDDGAADPMDRWSTRVIGALAKDLSAQALFPFGGPPFLPFYSWALRTGRIHAAPVQFLVHDTAGLFTSFRGALAFDHRMELPDPPQNPCKSCADQPCRTACPVGALTPDGYDVPGCKVYLDTPAGEDCVTQGCAVRRACPVSADFGRLPAQSHFHMRHFKGDHG